MSCIQTDTCGNQAEVEVTFDVVVELTQKGQQASLSQMKDIKELVLMEATGEDVWVVFDYPIRNPLELRITCPLTRQDLVRFIGAAYRMIYEVEGDTSSLPIERLCDRYPGCLLINRAPTDGRYGVYGHKIEDLRLHSVTYDPRKKRIYLVVGS